jgi:hypothetical protein
MKVRYRHNLRRIIGWLTVGGLLMGTSPALAALSQGFSSQSNLPAATIVALSASTPGTVVIADQTSLPRVIGVVVASGDSSLSLGAATGQVQVVSSGLASVFVSTAGGAIKSGDPIALSTVAGVGMRATSSGRIVGIAQGDFSQTTPGAEASSVGSGASAKQVWLGEVEVQVGVTAYSVQTPVSGVVGAVQNVANTISGKPVAVLRLFIAGAILFAAILSSTILLYSAVRNSIIATGRNPLARKAIYRSLAQILLVVTLILLVSAGAIYLVIK